MNKKYSSILVTGSIAFDEIADFPGKFMDFIQPDKLHQINISFNVSRLDKQLGGIATNIAYNLSLMTDKKKIILSGIGKDGNVFMNFFKKHAIDTSALVVDDILYTASGRVMTDMNHNQIWSFYDGACNSAKKIEISKISDKNSLVMLGAIESEAMMSLQKQAIKLGLDYIYDPGFAMTRISKEALQEGVNHCKMLIGNDYEVAQLQRLFDFNVETFIKKGSALITTLGKEGVCYQDAEKNITVPAYKLETILDPTGAGDAWRGGFIAGLLEDQSLEESLKWGNALASFAVQKYGTVNHNPTKDEIKKRASSLIII